MSESATYTFPATINATFTAKFRAKLEDEVVVTLTKDPDSTLFTAKGGGIYKKNDKVKLQAIAPSSYEFQGWFLNGTLLESKNSIYEFTITEDKNYTAKWSKSKNPYDDGGNSGSGGGGGSYDYNTDKIPYISGDDNAADIGFFTIYNVTKDNLKNLAYKLINTDITDLGTTFAKLFNKPLDAIMGLYLTKAPILTGTATTLKIGTWDSSISCDMLINQWNTKDMGSVTVNEYWGNDLDYTATSMEIWLPYIGFCQLDAAELMGKTINVKYKFNQLNGDCVAMIIVDDSVKYQFEGNIFVSLPYSESSSSAIKTASSVLLGAAGAAATIATGGAAAPAIASAAAGAAGAALSFDKSMKHGGSVGNSAKFLETQYPVLYIKRPRQNTPKDIANYKGLPSNITATLGTLSGYTKVREIHLDGLQLTDSETRELESILKNGFIIR